MAITRKKTRKKAGRKASTKGAAGAGNERMDFLVDYMKKNPKCVYAEAAAAAKAAGHAVFPIMWGRAQVMLGRAKQKPRGQGKAAMAKKATRAGVGALTEGNSGDAPVKRGPGRPRKTPEMGTAAPVKRGPGRPRKNPMAATSAGGRSDTVTIPVGESDLGTMQRLVDALNGGGRASLRYDGRGWELSVD